ncbi:Hydroxyindole-O-methyltransferase [Handroanthus impetiginosus]|uniref:Hydroxyindole-O-methyltransferase n=1 Tax=Handroanthus impetiginosus TaxID=429701 RepID=A0A2G9GAY3_9LAMI|nr:Hydroxyindole-O-methyltransferase [Handroanthus impetiginosus]
MALANEELSTKQLLEAQAHIWNHIFNFINSMSLKCAIELGIPDIIYKHGKPMTLSELVDALPNISKTKSQHVHRLMRILLHSNFFVKVNISNDDEEEEHYWLTPASRFLLKDAPLTVAPTVQLVLDPLLTKPCHYLSEWLANDHYQSTFEMTHGMLFWEYAKHEPRLISLMNEATGSDSRLVTRVLLENHKITQVFKGIESLVDVGGGNGTMAKAVVDAFPSMKCIVLDLPQAVAGLQETNNLTYVEGDMFQSIPPADGILLKWVLHDWDDEHCVKILKKCKEAILGKGGKVIIIDMVVDIYEGGDKAVENQLLIDMMLMTLLNGKERSEKEWAKLFLDAGFSSYKITPAIGLRSVIELYP